MKLFIGTSGYSYKHWTNGVFYPTGLPASKWLEFYARYFNCVELNVTFYRSVPASTYLSWKKRSPKNFTFVVKGPRFITHIKRLKDSQEPLTKFAKSVIKLKDKTTCFLWQFSPQFKNNPQRLRDFCRCLNSMAAFKGKRHVFEFRHESWFNRETYATLEDFNFCLCWASRPGLVGEDAVTSDFLYLRFHSGDQGGDYSTVELSSWLQRVRRARPPAALYAFFNNDAHGFAPKNAVTFRKMLIPRARAI